MILSISLSFLPCAVPDQLVHHLPGDVGHGDDVCDVLLRRYLPLPEDLRAGAGEDDGGRVPVPPGRYAGLAKAPDGVLGGVQHPGHDVPEPLQPVLLEGVPDDERSQRAPGAGDGGVHDAHDLDGAGDVGDVVLLGQHHAAGDGGTDELVAAYGHAVDAGVEPVGLGVRDEGQYHAAEGCVGVDVEVLDLQAIHDVPDDVQVVDRPLHGGPDVGDDYGGSVRGPPDGLAQVRVVHLSVRLAPDHDVPDVQEPEQLDDAVVGVLGEVDGAGWEEFPAHVQAVHVALGAAGGDVAPGFLAVQAHEVGEVGDDLPFDLVGVGPVVAALEGVSDVVRAVLEERQQAGIVEVLVGGVAHLPPGRVLEGVQEFVQAFSGRVRY